MENDSKNLKEILRLTRENNEMIQNQYGDFVAKKRQAILKKVFIIALIGVGLFFANKNFGSIMSSYEEVKVKAEETQQKLEEANKLRLELEENIKNITSAITKIQGITGSFNLGSEDQ